MAEKKKPAKKKKPTQKRKKTVQKRNAPLHIPLSFEQAVEALLQVKPKKKQKGG